MKRKIIVATVGKVNSVQDVKGFNITLRHSVLTGEQNDHNDL